MIFYGFWGHCCMDFVSTDPQTQQFCAFGEGAAAGAVNSFLEESALGQYKKHFQAQTEPFFHRKKLQEKKQENPQIFLVI